MPKAHRKREPERFVPTPPDLHLQLTTDGKIIARLTALMAGLFVFGVIALNAGFLAAAALCLLAAPAVLVAILVWYRKSGARERERKAKEEIAKKRSEEAPAEGAEETRAA